MRDLATLVCLSFALATAAIAGEKPQTARTRHAMVQPGAAARAGCLDRSRLAAEHTAYFPAADMMPPRCGKLLSTDTLVSAHHWNQT